MNATISDEEYVRHWLTSLRTNRNVPKVDPVVVKRLIDIHLNTGLSKLFTAAERLRIESLLLQSSEWAKEYARQLTLISNRESQTD